MDVVMHLSMLSSRGGANVGHLIVNFWCGGLGPNLVAFVVAILEVEGKRSKLLCF